MLLNALENAEECGHDENLADHADEHAADGSRSEGAVTVGTYPKGEHHGEQTNDHGHGGHQNRAQTSGGTVEGGSSDAHSHLSAVECKLYDEDGVFRQETHEHDERDLHVDVVLGLSENGAENLTHHTGNVAQAAHQVDEEEGTEQTEGNRQQHGEGQEVALVLCGEQKVDEDEAKHEDEPRGARTRGLLFAGETGILIRVTYGEGGLGHFFHGLHGLSGGVAVGRVTIDGNRGEHVETADDVGTFCGGERHELGDGSHFAAIVAHFDVVERLDVAAVGEIGLHHDAIDLTEAVEVGGIETAEVALQRGEHVGGRKTGALTLCSVDVDGVLREARVEVGLCRLDFGALYKFSYEVIGHFLEFREVTTGAVLKIERETVAHAVAGDHRGLEEEHLGVLKCLLRLEVEIGKDHGGAFGHRVAFFPRLEFDDERAVGRALSAEERETGNDHGVVYQGRGHDQFLNLAQHLVGAVLRCSGGEGDGTHDGARVFVGHEGGRGFRHCEHEQGDRKRNKPHRKPRTLHEVTHSFLIALEETVVSVVERIDETL